MTVTDCTTRGSSDRGITLGDFHILLESAKTVNLLNTLDDAVEIMDSYNIDQLPVVDPNYHGAMVVTRRAIATVPPSARGGMRVQDVLKEHSNDPNQRARSTTPLLEARQRLIDHDWILTTDEDDNPVGLATVGDALGKLLDRQEACCQGP